MTTQEQVYSSSKSEDSSLHEKLCKEFLASSFCYTRFHVIFTCCLSVQALGFLLFFSQLTKSAMSAFAVAGFLLTLFSYLVLLSFMQAKKSGEIVAIKENFFRDSEKLHQEEEKADCLLKLAHEGVNAFSTLSQQEALFYSKTLPIASLAPLFTKLRVKLHWKSFLHMKEQLLLASIENLITLIKLSPRDLEAHATLAQTYSKLSELYLHPNKVTSSPLPWVPAEYRSSSMNDKFFASAERAIEELIILQDYSADDPWIHAKLAEIYHLMGDASKEIAQYEKILETSSDDELILFRLGVLYFSQGQNAKGLGIYEKLQEMGSKKTEPLISHYDAFSFHQH